MIVKVKGATLSGIFPEIIDIEIGFSSGLSSFQIVGLPDSAINEAKERINIALKKIGAKPPNKFLKKIVVNLAPADIKKEGTLLDLPIALAFLFLTGQIKNLPQDAIFVGELGLDGSLRKVKGILPIALSSIKKGFKKLIIPYDNKNEANFFKEIEVYAFKNLEEVIDYLENEEKFTPLPYEEINLEEDYKFPLPIISDYILRGIILASLGRHNLLLYGPPGTGKTLIAKSLVYFLPSLSYEESLEISSIYSSLGLLEDSLIKIPPFRAPHHTSSVSSILGGGKDAKPGEVTLAHRGVLFFDELPEFRRDVLEGIREPLETGEITVARAKRSVKYPAKFLFVGAYNPCPCGFYGDEKVECKCTLSEIRRYQKKISGPLLDRIDINLNVPRLESEEVFQERNFDFKKIKEKILEVKEKIEFRYRNENFKYNSEIPHHKIKEYVPLGVKEEEFLKKIIERYNLSLRGIHKILKLSRTIADLEGKEKIDIDSLSEAVQYRVKESE
ncbi:MAG: YifB family Mg chelatase-like AAA ATPase [Candidatus Pacebacteria bacterium]|jgi:magnesium chelatase family protein|nr:YifB family Mg chelatase-like AAA ATPase [Candidatus Paceibacterota bacterium]